MKYNYCAPFLLSIFLAILLQSPSKLASQLALRLQCAKRIQKIGNSGQDGQCLDPSGVDVLTFRGVNVLSLQGGRVNLLTLRGRGGQCLDNSGWEGWEGHCFDSLGWEGQSF